MKETKQRVFGGGGPKVNPGVLHAEKGLRKRKTTGELRGNQGPGSPLPINTLHTRKAMPILSGGKFWKVRKSSLENAKGSEEGIPTQGPRGSWQSSECTQSQGGGGKRKTRELGSCSLLAKACLGVHRNRQRVRRW